MPTAASTIALSAMCDLTSSEVKGSVISQSRGRILERVSWLVVAVEDGSALVAGHSHRVALSDTF